ncbi:MAG: ribonuclease T [Methylococcaceae bacterium]|nr:ribonuclease T [Methylococcaceae bacterium]
MRYNAICLTLVIVFGITVSGLAVADDLGVFTATRTCQAVKSIKSGLNPGKVKVTAGNTYPAISLNKPNGSFVKLSINGAKPSERWVRLDCGTLADGSTTSNTASSRDNLLVLSWQPAFCDIHEHDGKAECDSETSDRFDATHFTLHGLWPQPKGKYYCNGVSDQDINNDKDAKDWHLLPSPPGLSTATLVELGKAMPGTASDLHRHEWIKHGTCFEANNAGTYFHIALALQSQVNNSDLQKFMESNIGKPVSATEINQAFEKTFGPGSSSALLVDCKPDTDSHRNLVVEVQIKLKGELTETTQLGAVLDKTRPDSSTCKNAIVDPVGF